MAFDPNQPFEVVGGEAENTGFDPAKPFEVVGSAQDVTAGRLESMHKSARLNPDEAARYSQLSKQAGVPFEVAKTNPVGTEKAIKAPAWRQFAENAPKAAKALADDPVMFQQAHDDIETLQALEQFRTETKKRGLPDLTRDYGTGFSSVAPGVQSYNKIENTANPEATAGTFFGGIGRQFSESSKQAGLTADMLAGRALGLNESTEGQITERRQMQQLEGSQQASAAAAPEFDTATGRFVFGGVSSAAQTAPTLAVGIANPALGLLLGGAQSGLLQSGDILTRGGSTEEALLGGAANALIEVGTEKIPLGFAAKQFGRMRMIDFVKGFAGREMVGEQIATLGQDAVDTAIANPDKTWEEYWKERPEAAVQTVFAVGATSTGIAVLQAAANKATGYESRAQVSQAAAGSLSQERDLLKRFNLANRNVEAARAVLDKLDGDEVQEVYIDPAQLFNQGAVTRADFEAAVPSAAAQLDDAIDKGGLIRVPRNELLLGLKDNDEAWNAVSQHLKVDPSQDTLFEATQAQESLTAEMVQMADQQIAASQNADELRSMRDRIMELDRQRMANSGLDPKGIEQVSALNASMAIAAATREGMNPEDVFNTYFGKVSRQLAGGEMLGVLNQGGGIESVRQAWQGSGIDGQVFENGDVITLSKIVVPDGSRGAGVGTQAMQQLIDYADANGKHVVLSPSADFGGNVKRLKNFYKRFGFVENKGKNRAFSTSESMYRQAQGKVLFQGGDTENKNSMRAKLEEVDFFEQTGIYTKAEADKIRSEISSKPQGKAVQNEQSTGPGNNQDAGYILGESDLLARLVRANDSIGIDRRTAPSLVGAEWTQASSYSDLSLRGGSFVRDERSPEVIKAESDRLIASAKKNGFFVDKNAAANLFQKLSSHKLNAGIEHDAFRMGGDDGGVVLRVTAGGRYGPDETKSPAQYLHRIEEYNKTFPELQMRVLGVGQRSDGKAYIITAQKFVDGKEFKNMDQLHAAMVAHGWEAMERDHEGKLTASRYRHKKTGAIISDVHEGNVLHDSEGNLYPIDVHVEKLPSNLLYQNQQKGPRGAFNPDTREIMLLPRADLSTFLHESGHLFLEITADLAARENASEGLKADMDAAFKWFGIKGETAQERMETWNSMTLDQKRPHHEKWAESFEAYLFEGKAPSMELREAFRNFRQWLTQVYKSLAQFLVSHRDARLNDEIRGVFDRMLATEQQIQEMEAARGMVPLFSVKPENMTDAEWKEYQDSAKAATESAIEQLTTRSLSDMRWLNNAKSKTLRKLQREEKVARREARMEAKRVVLSQDIYRAWQFLKAPVEGAKAANQKAKQSDMVDPARDSLFAAIAKLGGLNKDQAVSQYGIDPADYLRKGGVFGKPVLRVEGGMSPDAMAEALSQYGYMKLNDYGQWDIQDLDDMLREEAAGNPVYSDRADYDLLLGSLQIAPDKDQVDFLGGRLSRGALIEMYGHANPDVRWDAGSPGSVLNQPAFHGSPYKFDKFSLEHMGKGEGAQAYGWGLYFAGSESVAEYYRDTLSGKSVNTKDGPMDSIDLANAIRERAYKINPAIPDGMSSAIKAKASEVAQGIIYKNKTAAQIVDEINQSMFARTYAPIVDAIKEINPEPDRGQLYKVEIPEDDTYLLWDKPLSEQPEKVKKAIRKIINEVSKKTAVPARVVSGYYGDKFYRAISGGSTNSEETSKYLHSLGINGIKYLDGSSRGAGEGSYNYVIFDDSAIQILETYYQAGDDKKESSRSLESMKMVSDDGLHPDVVADLFGMSSGDELVRKLLTVPDPVAEIDRLTDEIMLQRHSDLATPAGREAAAMAAIHNDARARFLATELAMLNRAIGKPRMIMQAAKDYAARIVASTKIRDLRPGQYDAAEAKAGKESDKALKAGNTADAAMAKRNQVLHNMTAKMVREAQAEADKAVKYLKKFDKPNKRIDVDYQEQIDTLLERYDLRQKSLKAIDRSKTLAAWMKEQQALGLEPVIPDYLLDEAKRTHYKDLTVEELRGLVDAVKNIEHLGRLKNRLLTDKAKRELNAIGDEIAKSIGDNNGTKAPKLESNSAFDRAWKLADGFASMHRKLASIARQLDGWKDGGPMWQYLIRSMNEAGDREAVMHEQATLALADVFLPLKGKKLTAKLYIPMIADSLSYEGRLSVALNWGNEGNRQRLLDGNKWGVGEVNAILATLTAEDWRFVQGVWDHMETYRDQIGAQQKRLTGVEPDWIQPTPFDVRTADGQTVTVRGGYYPAKYDTDLSVQALSNEAAGNIMDQWKAAKGAGKTRDGFTKARAAAVKDRPLRKDLGVITQHVTEVTHRLAWQDWIVDTNRLLRLPQVEQSILAVTGDTSLMQEIRKAIEDIAAGESPAGSAFEKAVNHLRIGTTVAGLGWNVTTSLLQPFGLTQSMVRIGPKWVGKGLATFIGNPARMNERIEWVNSKSDFMRLRSKTMMREMNEILNSVRREKLSKVEATYFYAIQKMQMVADMPTWLGQYEKSMAEFGDEAKAIALADQAVIDAQGGGQVKDLARIQRGSPLLKLWTNFYSFFNTTYNLSREVAGRTDWRDPASVGHAAVDYLLLYTVPAVMGSLLKGAIVGDDDEDELASRIIRDQLSYLFGTMVGLREVAAAFSGFQGYSGPAGTRFFSEFARLGKQIEQGDADEAFWKALNNTGGILFHYPAGQINRTATGLDALANDRTDNPAALVFGEQK